jgi:hypothetical protein
LGDSAHLKVHPSKVNAGLQLLCGLLLPLDVRQQAIKNRAKPGPIDSNLADHDIPLHGSTKAWSDHFAGIYHPCVRLGHAQTDPFKHQDSIDAFHVVISKPSTQRKYHSSPASENDCLHSGARHLLQQLALQRQDLG